MPPAAAAAADIVVHSIRTFEVAGAAKALRGMWPLVFSKTEAVKEAVLDSWNILHLHSKTLKEQVGTARRWHHCSAIYNVVLQQLACDITRLCNQDVHRYASTVVHKASAPDALLACLTVSRLKTRTLLYCTM